MLRILRITTPVALGLLALATGGCNSGTATSDVRVRCADASSFCVASCNLGCSLGSCTVSEIAENQRIELLFSQEVDPASVTFANLGLATAQGEAAAGQFVVEGRKVTFVPDVSVAGGLTQFGFRRNETYVLNLRQGGSSGVGIRSASGDTLKTQLRCNLHVSEGVIDFDQRAPEGRLVTPSATTDVPIDAAIVVEFSEIIDVAPFQGASTATSPILYRLKPTTVDPSTGNSVCNVAFPPVNVEGVPTASVDLINNTTTISLQPTIDLPAGACVEVTISPGVRDLSGRAAVESKFTFLTQAAPGQDRAINERFVTAGQLDTANSSGTWGNGEARPGLIGGDGRHGPFDIEVGTALGNGVYEFDTANTTIPPRYTIDGLPAVVSDGQYYFENFVLDADKTLRFVGPNPVKIRVMGRIDIAGKIELNAADMTVFGARDNLSGALLPGQPGGEPGPGGGAGGDGGNRSGGTGTTPGVNGRNGEPVQLTAGHAYTSRAVNTGGRGTTVWPLSGSNMDVLVTSLFVYSGQMQAGGSGGGLNAAGQDGTVLGGAINTLPIHLGPDSPGGVAFDPFPIPAGASSLDHFLIGGSGGGGGGSHSFAGLTATPLDIWRAGAGGAGGGGAIALRSGNDLSVAVTGEISCRGGNGVTFSSTTLAGIPSRNRAFPAPGGGGSGGSVLLQSQTNISQGGTVDTSGGEPSLVTGISPPQLGNAETRGGRGSDGFIRFELPSGLVTAVGTTIPMVTGSNVGQLQDRDDRVADISKWYSTQLVFPPEYLRYEIDVDLGNGTAVTFSDDPSIGPLANDPNDAVRFYIQGAQVSALTGEPDPATIRFWRTLVGGNSVDGLNQDGATGFRFRLAYNRRAFPLAKVTRVTVVFRD